jgi:hypothetical protein
MKKISPALLVLAFVFVFSLAGARGPALAQTYSNDNTTLMDTSNGQSSDNTADPNDLDAAPLTPGIPSTGASGYAPALSLMAILALATGLTGATMLKRTR